MENPREIFLQEQTYATLFSVVNKIQIKGDEYLENMTSRQLMTMIAIVHLPEGEASLKSIARKLGTTKQSAKKLVDALEDKGCVVVSSNPKDKRAINVTITEKGNQVLYEDFHRGLEFFDRLFHEFTLDEMEILWNLLKRLYRFDGEEQDGFEENIEYAFHKNGDL